MIKKGKYRHFKGNVYEVVGEAKHSETLECLVLYKDEKGKMKALSLIKKIKKKWCASRDFHERCSFYTLILNPDQNLGKVLS